MNACRYVADFGVLRLCFTIIELLYIENQLSLGLVFM